MNKIKLTKEESEKLKNQIKMGIYLHLYHTKLLTTTQFNELTKNIRGGVDG